MLLKYIMKEIKKEVVQDIRDAYKGGDTIEK